MPLDPQAQAMLAALALRRLWRGAQNLAWVASAQIWLALGLAVLMMFAIDVEDR